MIDPQFQYIITAGDSIIAQLALIFVLSAWALFFITLFRSNDK